MTDDFFPHRLRVYDIPGREDHQPIWWLVKPLVYVLGPPVSVAKIYGGVSFHGNQWVKWQPEPDGCAAPNMIRTWKKKSELDYPSAKATNSLLNFCQIWISLKKNTLQQSNVAGKSLELNWGFCHWENNRTQWRMFQHATFDDWDV